MSKIIEIEISDERYEELLERASELQKSYFDICGKSISGGELICMAAELGIMPHIKNSMNILGHNLKNRGTQNE
ncbi:MAG: hypothetical protein ACI4JB_07475 [Porcipelethomonas sp.]